MVMPEEKKPLINVERDKKECKGEKVREKEREIESEREGGRIE
jgi:hypothetical protein